MVRIELADEIRKCRQQFRCDILVRQFRLVEKIPAEEGGMVAKSTDAACDMFEIALHNAVAAAIAAVETDECAELVGSPIC